MVNFLCPDNDIIFKQLEERLLSEISNGKEASKAVLDLFTEYMFDILDYVMGNCIVIPEAQKSEKLHKRYHQRLVAQEKAAKYRAKQEEIKKAGKKQAEEAAKRQAEKEREAVVRHAGAARKKAEKKARDKEARAQRRAEERAEREQLAKKQFEENAATREKS